MAHRYTDEQKEFIKNNVKGRISNELTELVNKHFGINLSVRQIRTYMKNHKLTNGLNTTFKKGHTPFNKGKKGVSFGGKETQFKKGNKSHNWVPVGSERINGDGYIDIKIDDGKLQNNWKAKHILIWEEHNGPVPEGHVVIFGDGDNRNFDINNLILVSRKQLLMLNRNNLIQDDADLTRTGVIIADIYLKAGERGK